MSYSTSRCVAAPDRQADLYAPDLLAITLDQDGRIELRIPGCND